MSTHAVTGDTDAVGVQLGESTKDSLRQLLSDVAVHVVAVVIRGLGGIDVKPGTSAEVICIVLALNVEAAFSIHKVRTFWFGLVRRRTDSLRILRYQRI